MALKMKNTAEEYDRYLKEMEENWLTFGGMRWFQILYKTSEDVVRQWLPPPLSV